ncbi:MAG: putative ABC transport system permease protein, partial [Rhodothermales bacterium]
TRIDDQTRVLIEFDDQSFYEPNFFYADSSVFAVFSLPLTRGLAESALARPGTVVLSEETARRYFGDTDPIGRSILADQEIDLEVTGVFRNSPQAAHFAPELITSFHTRADADNPVWLNNSFFTYLLVDSPDHIAGLEAKMPAAVRQFVGPQVQQFLGMSLDEAMESGFRYDWKLVPMPGLYLHNQADDQMGQASDIRYVRLLGIIALFILAIACVNFMNLATARAAGRAREVGVRKALGSERRPLILQFLAESVTLSLIAMVFALGLLAAVIPFFNGVAGAELTLGLDLFLILVLVAVFTGLLAGIYPAFFLSGFTPAFVLRGRLKGTGNDSKLRSGLVVFQFAVSVVLLIGTTVVFKQLQFIQDQDVGFDKTSVVVLPIETASARDSFAGFRQRLKELPEVVEATAAGILPGPNHIHNNTGFRSEGMDSDDILIAALGEVSQSYVETLGLEVVAGRDFDAAYPSDRDAWVINEATARQLGWTTQEAVGKRIARLSEETDRWGTVIGVVRDAHFRSLRWDVQPMVFGHQLDSGGVRYAAIRVNSSDMSGTLSRLEQLYTGWEAGHPFSYYFMDEDYQAFYEQEQRLGTIFTSFSILAILIACLGLFGLSAFVTTERTKEIGVRKVLGASVPGIVVMLSRNFTILVLVSCVLAFPIAYLLMSSWLADFAYSTTLTWTVFAGSGLTALAIAWLTVSFQSVRAATRNPVRSLRYE